MYGIKYRIVTISPILVSTKFGDMNIVTTEKYIPGSSVLGILTRRYIMKKNISHSAHKDENFFNWFLAGNLKISNAYIFSEDKDDRKFAHFPVPNSIKREKNGDQIYDFLYAKIDTDDQMESIDGFCSLNEQTCQLKSVETTLNFHHARDREKGISREGIIFNYESISPNQVFTGNIVGNENDLLNFMEICGKEKYWIAYIGRSRNAQYGKVKFEFIEEKPIAIDSSIPSNKKISLTLLSDTIIYNENGFPCIDIVELEKYIGAKIEKTFIKKGDVENFVGVWRLKKPSEICFLAGSTFLLDISKSEKNKLKDTYTFGIGERTHEGFGQCILGLQNNSELEILEESKDDSFIFFEKPEFLIPEQTLKTLKILVTDYIKKQVELSALIDLNEFKNSLHFLTNSIIEKLLILAKPNEQSEFTKIIKQFRKPAKEKLERCNNGKISLFEFLIKRTITIEELLRSPSNSNLKKLCAEIKFYPEADKQFEKELYKLYLATFFSMMRKNMKINM